MSSVRIRLLRILAVVLVTSGLTLVGLTACDSTGDNADATSTLEVGFQTVESSSSSSSATLPKHVTIDGSNGTLTIEEIRFILEDFELDVQEGEDSLDFEAEYTFLNLPLESTDYEAAGNFEVPPEVYDEFEFEIDDVDADDDDSEEERQQIEDLFEEIRNIDTFSDWPRDASMVAIGTFNPSDGDPQDFHTYMETEVEVERELSPPLEVTEDGLNRSLTVTLDPALWFERDDGTVINLYDWQLNDDLLEIENEFEDGVVSIEIDED